MVNNGKDQHASLSETATDLTRGGDTDTRDQNLVSNAKDEHAVNSIRDGETGNVDHNLVSNAKDEHTNHSEAAVNSNGDGEISTRDQNQVNSGKDEPGQFLGTTDVQSVSMDWDWDSDWNWDAEVPNKDLNVATSGKDELAQPSEVADGQSNMDFNGHLPNGKKCDISVETIRKLKEENAMLIQRETISEKTIQILAEENDTHIRKEVMSLKIIRKLNEENHMHIQKEAISEETIRKLNEQKDMHVQKEVALEEKIRKLKKELDMHVKKGDISDETIRKLKDENAKLIQRETISEKTIQILTKENDTHIRKEVMSVEMIGKLRDVNHMRRMRIQKEAIADKTIRKKKLKETIRKLNEQKYIDVRKEVALEETIGKLKEELNMPLKKEGVLQLFKLYTETPKDTASDVKETKDADTDTVSRSIYSNDQLEELVSRLAAPGHLSSPVSALFSGALSQIPDVQKISEIMQKLKVLVEKDLDSIMSTNGVVGELSSLVKYLDKIKDHLNAVDFGTFYVVQMVVGCFESDFPNIKLALSNYHDVHQEQQAVRGRIQELIQRRRDVNDKYEELNQRKQQVTNHINVLQHDLQEAENELVTVLADMDINAASIKDIESKIDEEYPNGVSLVTKMSSIQADYNFALVKKASLAEDWASVQACVLSKSL